MAGSKKTAFSRTPLVPMLRCIQCRRLLDASLAEFPPICPYCGRNPAPLGESSAWVPIARVTSLAELGFFVDRLEGDKVESRIDERDDFDAVSGRWEKTFVVRVPEHQSERAVRILRADLSEPSDAEADFPEAPATGDSEAQSVWMPLALILLAGGLVYVSSRARSPSLAEKNPGREKPALWRVLSETEAVYQSPRRPGQAYRALRYDSRRRVLLLDEDLDGDGRFDRRREFKNGVLVKDRQN